MGRKIYTKKLIEVKNLAKNNSGNGQEKSEKEKKGDQSISVWSQHTGSLIYFPKPPLLLAHFPLEIAEKFLAMGFDEQYDLHDDIMKEGQIGKDMFLLCEGEVAIYSQGVKMATLEKGDVFGELILFRNHYRIASVKVEKSARLLRYSREILKDFFARHGQKIFDFYMMNLMEILRRKLIATNRKVVALEQELLKR
ncbi:cyclic nucleotide-binding domain-containing protein [Candidatus Marinimicrobia bacterium MT.SAG.3]|nr:cyclic nucleotide-binding domain-containing protein [Candidatus Marinimicrobia bacterium MT.SAG.3]